MNNFQTPNYSLQVSSRQFFIAIKYVIKFRETANCYKNKEEFYVNIH